MTGERRSRWVVPLQRDATVRLICFPYAGGGASVYRRWCPAACSDVQLCAAQLPGREERLGEPAISRLSDLVPRLVEAVAPYCDGVYAFFGHSMGALIAFELTRALRRAGAPLPAHLFISGRAAPHLPPRRRPLHALPEAEFLIELQRLQGTPRAVLDCPELIKLMIPTLRADFAVCETYQYTGEDPLDVPISAFGGVQDPEANEAELRAWGQHTLSFTQLRMFAGDHFFLHTSGAGLVQAMRSDVMKLRLEPTSKT